MNAGSAARTVIGGHFGLVRCLLLGLALCLLPGSDFRRLLYAAAFRNAAAETTAAVSGTAAAPRHEIAWVDSLWKAGQRDSAAAVTRAGLERARDDGDSLAMIDLLTRAGQQSRFFGRGLEGEQALREGMALAWARADTARAIAALRWLCVLVGMQGRAEDARALSAELLALAEATRDVRYQGWGCVGLAWDAVRTGRADEAVAWYARAAPLFAEVHDVEGALWSLLGIGRAETSRGNLHTAAAAYRRAIALAKDQGEPVSEGIALNDLGAIEFYLGDPGEALNLFERSRALHRRTGSLRETVLPATNIALCLRDLGREAAAGETLNAALALCRERGERDLEITVRTHLANLSAYRGLPREAARRYRELLREDDLSLRSRVQCLMWLADAVAAADSHEVALELLTKADARLADHGENELRPIVLLSRARALRALGRTAEAQLEAQSAAEAARQGSQQGTRIDALVESAAAWRTLDRPDSTRQALLAAADLWETDRGRPLDPAWREQRGGSGRRLYTDLGLALAAGSVAEAFDRLQAFKSRTLLERMLGPGAPLERRSAAERAGLCTLRRLQESVLRPDELFLDCYLGPEVSILFAVTADTARIVRLPGERTLQEKLQFYHQLAAKPPARRGDRPDLDPIRHAGRALAQTLFAEIEPLLARSRVVQVSPDGALSLIPLAELHEHLGPESSLTRATGRADGAPIWVRVPSATVLDQLRGCSRAGAEHGTSPQASPGSPPARILAIAGTTGLTGRRLNGGVHEVRELDRRFRNVNAQIDPSAADSIEAMLSGPDVLHLAAHLLVDQQNPWQSEIQFHPPGSSGNLRAAEIAELQLSASLAVLSSCASASGRVLSGEGVLGVTSAFLSAGVPCVVATLWPVDDRTTAGFMGHFYDGLARGETVATALVGAQAMVRADPVTEHPFFWAGFVAVGDGEVTVPLERRPGWLRFAPLGLAGALAAVGALASICRSREV